MNEAMIEGMKVGAAIGVVMIVVFLVVAFNRRGGVGRTTMGGRRLEVQTAALPDAAFAGVQALGAPYKVDDADRARGLIVLSTAPSFTTWGFFYPVEIVARPGGGSTIHVGIKSKVIQVGPIVGIWHRRCVQAIEAQLALPVARVV